MEEYLKGNKDYFLCKICGKADAEKNWIGGLTNGLCFNCSFWSGTVKAYNAGERIVIDGRMYFIGPEDKPILFKHRGYGGNKFYIKKLSTEEIITTTNLWHNGKVPEIFRDQLMDNAEFVKEN